MKEREKREREKREREKREREVLCSSPRKGIFMKFNS